MLNRFFAFVAMSLMLAASAPTAVRAADTALYESLCTRLMEAADSPATYHQASNVCLQAAVGHKRLAEQTTGAHRQSQLLLQAGFMTLAAQAESHGGDEDVRRQLLDDAADIARSVKAHALTAQLKSDASRLLSNIESMQ
jgi:hypothetical protein